MPRRDNASDKTVPWRGLVASTVCAALIGGAALSLPEVEGRTSVPDLSGPGYTADPVPVVVLAFDELPVVSLMGRDGDIDEHLFPNFSALRQTSTWYRNATTVAELTRAALPAILTGQSPEELSLSLGGRIPQSLFTIFRESHEVRASRAFPTLCDLDVCRPTPPVDPPRDPALSVFGREARGRAFVAFLEMLDPERPCICVLHLVMPHSPWRYLPTGQQYPGTDPMPGQAESPGPGRRWRQNDWLVRLAHARHLMQLGFVDGLLGQVVDRLKEAELWDEAMVVVVADHGIAFQPDEHKRAATPATLGEVAYVPLFVKTPGQVIGAAIDDPVETIDVVPTIAEMLNLESGPAFDGISLNEPQQNRVRRVGGEYVDIGASERDEAVIRKFERFPHVRSWADLFAIAPRRALPWMGQYVSAFDEAGQATATMPSLEAMRTASPLDPRVPALVEGELDGSDPRQSTTVLLSVDGRIVAATETYHAAGKERFYAIVPPASYAAPPHAIQLFRLTSGGTLQEIPLGR